MSPVGRCYKCQIVEQAYSATIAWFTAIFKSERSGYGEPIRLDHGNHQIVDEAIAAIDVNRHAESIVNIRAAIKASR